MIQHMVWFLHVWHILFPRETKQLRQPQGEWHCLCEQHCRNTPKSAPSSALPLTNSRTSSTTQVCSASPTLCSSVLPYFLFFLQYIWGAIHRPENQSLWDENEAQRRRRGRLDFLRGQAWLWISNFLYRNPRRRAVDIPHKAPSPAASEPVFAVPSVAVLNLHPYWSPSCFQSSRMNPPGDTGTAAGTAPSK